jgi:hypothetical protein
MMAGKASGKFSSVRVTRVRFTRPVKTNGRWYMAGDEATFSNAIAKDMVKRGLVKELETSSCGSKESTKVKED